MKPMYAPFDNGWLKIGNVGKIKQEDVGVQFKYKRKIKEAYMPEAEIEKNVWVLKATPAVLEKCIKGRIWSSGTRPAKPCGPIRRTCPTSHFPANVPTLGCGFKWRKHKVLGQVFLCPCHLSIYDAGGKVLDGPAPRPLDPLPIQVSASGEVANHRYGIQGRAPRPKSRIV